MLGRNWIEGLQQNFGHPHCQNPVETILLGTGSRPHMLSVCNLLFVVSWGKMMLNKSIGQVTLWTSPTWVASHVDVKV